MFKKYMVWKKTFFSFKTPINRYHTISNQMIPHLFYKNKIKIYSHSKS